MEGTAEDRLLLAGLRRLGDRNRTPGERRGPASPTEGELTTSNIRLMLCRLYIMDFLFASLEFNVK